MPFETDRLAAALDALPNNFRGPGGVAAVVGEGKVLASRAWGHADVESARPMTSETRLPICSISKQFTCGVLVASCDPDALDNRVGTFLPNFEGPLPTVRELCHNQSGLRDYWALTVLHGGRAEQTFARDDALPMIGRMKTGHFAPGTRYSYCNCNFRIVSELVEEATGETLEALYRRLIWEPAGMASAVLTSDTRHPADGTVGYEGSDATGFMPADNGIFWIGDAGISLSLKDMVAYEQWIDRTRGDADGIYRRISAPMAFRDGAAARYGFGLARDEIAGQATTGHGGALRGFRAHRLHAAGVRLSVFVAFNHEADAQAAASGLIAAALGKDVPARGAVAEDWAGQWRCEETGLVARIEPSRHGALLHYATGPDVMDETADGLAGCSVLVAREGDGLRMRRAQDNIDSYLAPLPAEPTPYAADISGRWICAELGAEVMIEARGGGVTATFAGMLGSGRPERVHPAGCDTWIVASRRSMDAPAPGDWTLTLLREDGRVVGLTLGCWLARGLGYLPA